LANKDDQKVKITASETDGTHAQTHRNTHARKKDNLTVLCLRRLSAAKS